MKNRSGFSFLFLKFFFNSNLLFFSLIYTIQFKFTKVVNFANCLVSIYKEFYVNFSNLWNYISKINTNLTIFFAVNFHFNRLIRYNYWTYMYEKFISHDMKLNKNKIRREQLGRHGHLTGFKFHCVGRFSRKQRATSKWFIENKLPLNTLNSNIDYGFFSVPLKNSSAGIRIWLYKEKNYTNFYFKMN